MAGEAHDEWLRFLQDVELARNYPAVYGLEGAVGQAHPLLDELLGSFLFIRLASFIDASLDVVISRDGLAHPVKKKKTWLDLNDRIEILEHHGRLLPEHVKHLHQVRDWRNKLAHRTEPVYASEWTWLDEAIRVSEAPLQHLALVGPRPAYEFFAEQGKGEASSEPGILYKQTYRVGLKLNGNEEVVHQWTRRYMRESGGAA